MKKYFLLIAFLIVGVLIALKFKQSSTDHLSQVVQSTENAVNEVATNVSNRVENAVSTATETVEQTANSAAVAAENIADKTKTQADQALETVKENAAEAAQDAANAVKKAAENTKETLNEAADKTSTFANKVASNLKAELVRDTSGKATKIEVPTVEFEANQAVIKDSSKSVLTDVAKVIQQNKEVTKVQVEGYTDTSGNSAKNLELSQKRAEAVADYLNQAGVERKKLVAKGFGSEKPITSNETAEGRATNRRVEFKIIH